MNDDVKLIRIVTGEEILCTIEDNGHEVTVYNPTYLIPKQDGSLGMMHFLPYCDYESITFKQDKILFITKPKTELAEQYLSLHRKVVVPSQQILT